MSNCHNGYMVNNNNNSVNKFCFRSATGDSSFNQMLNNKQGGGQAGGTRDSYNNHRDVYYTKNYCGGGKNSCLGEKIKYRKGKLIKNGVKRSYHRDVMAAGELNTN